MDISPASLFASVLVSAVGVGVLLYGRKERRAPHLVAGVVLTAYPYFVEGATTMLLIGAGLLVALWACVRFGL